MPQTISVQLPDAQVAELGRLGRHLGRSPSEMAAMLLDEALRAAAFSSIVFRDSPEGRQVYVRGTILAAWEVVLVARSYGGGALTTARHINWRVVRVQVALHKAPTFAEELEQALDENDAQDFTALAREIPQIEQFLIEDGEDLSTTAPDASPASG